MKDKIKIVLFDIKESLVEAWKSTIPNSKYPFVKIHQGSFETLTGDIIVSPANSFGFMNGGIDGAYTEFFGEDIPQILQMKIRLKWGGEIPVGMSEIIPLRKNFSYMISAPTMRIPHDISNTANVYLATRSVLINIQEMMKEENKDIYPNWTFKNPVSVYIPGMGTGVGNVSPKVCALQMRKAIDDIVLKEFVFPNSLREAYWNHVSMIILSQAIG